MLPDQRRVILYPQDLSVIYRFVMKYSALPRHPCYALVAEVWPLTVSIVSLFGPSDAELGWILLGYGPVVHQLCDTIIKSNHFFSILLILLSKST